MDEKYVGSSGSRREDFRSHVNVATILLGARLDQQMTQDELGRAAGTKQSRISEIEALKGNPRFETLDRIARVLGLMITLTPRHGPRSPATAAIAPWSDKTLVHQFRTVHQLRTATTSSNQAAWGHDNG